MYNFEYQNEKKFTFSCKLCNQEVSFAISRKEYEKIEEFPIGKEFIHGDPKHKLVIYLNKDLEIEQFKVEDVIEDKGAHYSQELTKQVLSDIGLDEDDIRLYFLTTGRGVVSLAELSTLSGKSKDDAERVAEKFIEKGLYKKITGATPHYFTLPPYSALIYQLQDFQRYANEVKQSTLTELNQSFSQLDSEAEGLKKLREFSDFVIELKQNLLSQMSAQKASVDSAIANVDNIKNITGIISNLESDVRKAIDNQLLLVKKKKLKEELEQFFNRFALHLKESLENTIKSINEIITTAETAKENVRQTFADVSKNFSKVLMEGEEKLSDIAEGVSNTLTNVKETFSGKVLATFNEMLEKILKRLEISEITTREFWEQSKQTRMFTMRDVWFVKSVAEIKTQIRDELPNSKMRILIVAPDLTDIEDFIDSFKICPSRVNIRIATYVDPREGNHVEILQKLHEIPNVDLRLSEVKDVWGFNKDSEIVIICALSYTPDGKLSEVAGMGTSTHYKIFVPVIEDIWMSSKKQQIQLYKRSLGLG
ncbi:MAG: hypothetical protein ACTSR8_18175 [Promethearchaeota archaeon]